MDELIGDSSEYEYLYRSSQVMKFGWLGGMLCTLA